MKKALLGVALLTLSAWGRPYRDGICEAEFPGSFSKVGHVASLALPQARFLIITWTTPAEEAVAMLRQLYQHSSYRGQQCEFLNQGGAQGLQFIEKLPQQVSQSQYFVTSGVCYEIRVCSQEANAVPEVSEFFQSIRFRTRTVNLRQWLAGGPTTPPLTSPRMPARPANPYEF